MGKVSDTVRILFRKFQSVMLVFMTGFGSIVRILFRKFQRVELQVLPSFENVLESYLESFKGELLRRNN